MITERKLVQYHVDKMNNTLLPYPKHLIWKFCEANPEETDCIIMEKRRKSEPQSGDCEKTETRV